MNIETLDIENLKTIRLGLNKVPFSTRNNILATVKKIDAILAEHNLKFEMVARPKAKYQRSNIYDYVFNPINK